MLTNLIFLVLLSSGSVFAAVRLDRRYEQTFPLCLMGSVMVLFAFGLLGALEAGALCLLLLALCLYLLTGISLKKAGISTDFCVI